MESTKIWKDTQNILKENLPKIIREIFDSYPPESSFSFYKSLAEHLHGISIVYIIQKERTKEDFLAFSQEYFPEEIRGKVKRILEKMAKELEKYRDGLSPDNLKEYYEAENLVRKMPYIG